MNDRLKVVYLGLHTGKLTILWRPRYDTIWETVA